MNRLAVLCLLLFACSVPTWATANNCGTGGSGSPNFTDPTTSMALPATSCQTIDKIFSNFAVTATVSGCTDGTAAGGGNTACTSEPDSLAEMQVLGTLAAGTVSSPTRVSAVFRPTTASVWDWDPDDSGTNTLTVTLDFVVTVDTASFANQRIRGFRLGFNHDGSIGTGDGITAVTDVCYAQTTVCTSGIDATSGTFSASGTTGASTANLSNAFLFGSGQTQISLRTVITLTDGTTSGVLLNNFQIDFYENPEPSTWIMLSSGLGLLGFIQHRRRSKRS